MDAKYKIIQNKETNNFALTILNLPPKHLLVSTEIPGAKFNLVSHRQQKINLALYQTSIAKSKLLTNLEIYQWRSHTDFPIVKVFYVNLLPREPQSYDQPAEVYLENCPLKLAHIFDLNIGQSFFFIKECIVGFERLFHRFGGFGLTAKMIAVNEKGQCRVWLNQNFSVNSFFKKEAQEIELVRNIISLIQSHTLESKTSKSLFQQLSKESTFLGALKAIESMVRRSKILLPTRFFSTTLKNTPHSLNPSRFTSTQLRRVPDLRNSTQSNAYRPFPLNHVFQKICSNASLMSSVEKAMKSKKAMNIQSEKVKKIKSEEKLFKFTKNSSDRETAITYGGKNVKLNQKLMKNEKLEHEGIDMNGKMSRKWIEESSFIMGEQVKETSPGKGQMTHSEALHFSKNKNVGNSGRKYSININTVKSVKNYDSERKADCKRRKGTLASSDEEERIREHWENIIKCNGWEEKFRASLSPSKEVQKSLVRVREADCETGGSLSVIGLDKLCSKKKTRSIRPSESEQQQVV